MKTSDEIKTEIAHQRAIIERICDEATRENREINAAEGKQVDAVHAILPKLTDDLERTIRIESDRLATVAAKMEPIMVSKFGKGSTNDAKRLRSLSGKSEGQIFNSTESVAASMPRSNEAGPYAFGELILAKACGTRRSPSYIQNAMKEMDNASGGFLVPNGFSSSFIDLARNQMAIMQAGATTMTMDTADVTMALVNSDPTAYVKAEMDLATESGITFGAARLDAQTVVIFLTMSRELAEDAPNAAQLIVDVGSKALATQVDEWALVGKSGSFTGLTGNTAIHETTSVGSIDWLDFSEAATLCRLDNYEPKAAILNPRIYDDVHTISVGDGVNSQRGWLPRPESIKDLAFLPTNSCPLASAVVGDFSTLIWGIRVQPTVEVSTTSGDTFQRHAVAVKIYWRGDFVLTRPSSLERLSGITS